MGPIKAILFEPSCLADGDGPYEDVQPAFDQLRSMGVWLETPADPAETMYVTDNAAGLEKARAAGMIPILLMHNPDEAMRLVTTHKPEGAVVSLLELPDFLRLVSANSPRQKSWMSQQAGESPTPQARSQQLARPVE